MSIHIFLGPSLALNKAKTILKDAIFHPPAAMGDIYGAVRHGKATLIGLIDGYFENTPAVWHKEILYALQKGVPVLGSSSMGALRAAELHPFGMEGIGRVFESYKNGELTDDDEVALLHGPSDLGYPNISQPMVNIRTMLDYALANDKISIVQRDQLLSLVKSLFYPERTWEAFECLAIKEGFSKSLVDELIQLGNKSEFDVKGLDAQDLLKTVAERQKNGFPKQAPTFVLEKTSFWHQLVDSCSWHEKGPEVGLRNEQIRNHHRLNSPDRDLFNRLLLLQFLVEKETDRLNHLPSPDELREAIRHFRYHRGLLSSETMKQWLNDNDMTTEDLTSWLRRELTLNHLQKLYSRDLNRLVPMELKRTGHYPQVRSKVLAKQKFLKERGLMNPTLKDAGLDENGLLNWYVQTYGGFQGSIENHALELGFESMREFLNEVLAEFMLKQQGQMQEQSQN